MALLTTNKASAFLESFESTGYSSRGDALKKKQEKATAEDTWRYGSPGDIRKAGLDTSGRSYGPASGPVPTRTTTRTVRKGDAPTMPELPTFVAPEMDKRKTRALTQKLAAPGIRTLRQTMQQAMGRNYENPNVRKLTLREALQGYGTGLEKVMSGAGREARSEQMAEIDLQRQQQMVNFQAQTAAAMQSYQNAWADYLKGEETVRTSGPDTGDASGIGGFRVRTTPHSNLYGWA